MLSRDDASNLMHELETRLDGVRSGRDGIGESLIDAMLAAVDGARSDVLSEPGSTVDPRIAEALSLLCSSVPPAAASLDISFALDGTEVNRLRTTVVNGRTPYILEKVVDASLSDTEIDLLPIFQTIATVGVFIARRIKSAGSAGAVLTILFASEAPADDLSYRIFDPFYPVRLPSISDEPQSKLPRILIVDDDHIALLVLQHFLSGYGRVDTAVNGEEAIEKFRGALLTDPYRAAFLDIVLPGIDGHATLSLMREAESAVGIHIGDGCRIVMSSALSDFPSISTSFREQCDAYLVKPYDRDAVEAAMKKLAMAKIPIDPSMVPGHRR